MRLDKSYSWRIDIVPGFTLGDFDLLQRWQSSPWFISLAKPQSSLVS